MVGGVIASSAGATFDSFVGGGSTIGTVSGSGRSTREVVFDPLVVKGEGNSGTNSARTISLPVNAAKTRGMPNDWTTAACNSPKSQ